MANTFLDRFKKNPLGMGQGVWDRAISAGYSGKQIAVASQKEQAAGTRIGQIFADRRHAAAMAVKGSSNNWIHNFTGGSGGVGMGGLQAALGAGRTLDEIIAATSGLHRENNNWGVKGFGQGAAKWILDKQQRDEFRAEQDAENAATRDQMAKMMEMYSKPPEPQNISKSAAYAVGTSGNASLKASSSSKKGRSSVRKTWGRGGAGFQSSLNSGATASAASASKSLNV